MKKRYIKGKDKYVESVRIENFLKDIDEVCKKHGLSISHEDGHG